MFSRGIVDFGPSIMQSFTITTIQDDDLTISGDAGDKLAEILWISYIPSRTSVMRLLT